MAKEVTFHEVMRWSDEECRDYLEAMRWPDGPTCPKCGGENPYVINRKSETKNTVRRLYRCRSCKKQFTPTVGTIFEDSHIPLHKWFAAIYLMCASKKGISAHQLHRQLTITYKSAWFMCHRIRAAMQEKGFSLLTGTVEADETYIHRRTRSSILTFPWHRPRTFRPQPVAAGSVAIKPLAELYFSTNGWGWSCPESLASSFCSPR